MALQTLKNHLQLRTYLVGEQIYLADIVVASAIMYPFKFVLDKEFRKPYSAVNRWLATLVNQAEFQAVVGDMPLIDVVLTAEDDNSGKKDAKKDNLKVITEIGASAKADPTRLQIWSLKDAVRNHGPNEAQPGRPGDQEAGADHSGQDHPRGAFKGVEFFDVGGVLVNPEKLQLTFDLFVQAVAPFKDEVDAIGCFDARGFLFAPYLGALFQTCVFMLRKTDKMPSISDAIEYFKEYKGDNSEGGDHLSIQPYAVNKGDHVLLVYDVRDRHPPRTVGGHLRHGLHLRGGDRCAGRPRPHHQGQGSGMGFIGRDCSFNPLATSKFQWVHPNLY
ncbi:hypothetical protein PF002_g21015 [Phytophthora fragariae]|uniref:GST C-terminal domain-containing protein n=1 Tax=Phytophthora fragariae TaxID=53985 RepID=A0A6A4CNE1_9STRA|nr:hypothetical protein PF002_g21015 [Phytophthora fragariae]KAE9293564.1 hypothetical protein PF001_g18200 [Phytophthora fragariae]